MSQPNILDRITAERRSDAERAERRVPLASLERLAGRRCHQSLMAALRAAPAPRIIAEVKKASPSAGLLRRLYRPGAIARQYQAAGAIGISVLTEPRHFLGSPAHLRAVRAAVPLPILRKDFISRPYQVAEAAAWGADVILIIAAALDRAAVHDLFHAAAALGLEAIIEVHTEAELELALQCPDGIIGVNSRDLKTLRTDLAVALGLARRIPDSRLAIAESGIRTGDDIARLQDAGYAGFLIGESLLRSGRPGDQLADLRQAAGRGL